MSPHRNNVPRDRSGDISAYLPQQRATFYNSKWIGLDHLKSAVRPPLQITPNAQPLKCRDYPGRPLGGAGLMLVIIKWLQAGRKSL